MCTATAWIYIYKISIYERATPIFIVRMRTEHRVYQFTILNVMQNTDTEQIDERGMEREREKEREGERSWDVTVCVSGNISQLENTHIRHMNAKWVRSHRSKAYPFWDSHLTSQSFLLRCWPVTANLVSGNMHTNFSMYVVFSGVTFDTF